MLIKISNINRDKWSEDNIYVFMAKLIRDYPNNYKYKKQKLYSIEIREAQNIPINTRIKIILTILKFGVDIAIIHQED